MVKFKGIYLLDRNIISGIRSGYKKNSQRYSENINRARSLDRRGNIVSALTSISEGNKKGPLSREEFYKNLRKDNLILKDFYKNAKVDENFIDRYKSKLYSSVEDEVYDELPNLTKLVNHIQYDVELHNARNIDQAKHTYSEIIKLFNKSTTPKGGLIKLIATSAIFGSTVAAGIFKPKPSSSVSDRYSTAYNTIMDVHALRTINFLNANIPGIKVQLITLDRDLEQFHRAFSSNLIEITSILENGTDQLTLKNQVNEALFPLAKTSEDKEFVAENIKLWVDTI